MIPGATYQLLPGFDPASSTLQGPFACAGTCLSKARGIIPGRTLTFQDSGITPADGDMVTLRMQPKDPNASIVRATKVLQWEDPLSEWVLVSDEGWRTYASASHVIRSMWPVVCVIRFDEWWHDVQILHLPRRALLDAIPAEPRDTGRRVFSVASVSVGSLHDSNCEEIL
jgi:hypothetical protein